MAANVRGNSMPQFLKLGELWINADPIIEVPIDDSKDGRPASCRIKLLGEGVRDLTGEQLTAAVLAFWQTNEVKQAGQRKGPCCCGGGRPRGPGVRQGIPLRGRRGRPKAWGAGQTA